MTGAAVVLLAVVNCSSVGCVLSEEEEELVGGGKAGVVSCVVQSEKNIEQH